jgi:hypothetical protein
MTEEVVQPEPIEVPARARRGPPRVAVVYFGITRSLRHTVGSIRRNVVEAARSVTTDVRQVGHFYSQDRIDNPRSQENGPLDPEEYRLLDLDAVEREAPGACLEQHGFDRLKAAGDAWNDNFVSLRNLVHQLHSLQQATRLALALDPDIVIFARPDLYYHAPLTDYLHTLAKRRRHLVMVPDWATCWHGFNDRAAVVKGEAAMRAYGMRAERMLDYCAAGRKLHAERFLKFALAGFRVQPVPLHASRVRSNGLVVQEDFKPGRSRWGSDRMLSFAEFEARIATGSELRPEGLARHG